MLTKQNRGNVTMMGFHIKFYKSVINNQDTNKTKVDLKRSRENFFMLRQNCSIMIKLYQISGKLEITKIDDLRPSGLAE